MTTASAPASAANLGPGYDVLALALELRCRLRAEPAASWEVTSAGEAADDAAVDMVRRTAEAVGVVGPFSVSVESAIPVARGLGSSAALIVSAAGAFRSHAERPVAPSDLLAACTSVEGHPDNVAAALFGGLVAVSPSGVVHRLEMHRSLGILVAVPDQRLATEQARKATAPAVETGVASRTASRLAFLIEGLRTGDRRTLVEAGGDELHELRRTHLSPITARLIEAAIGAGAAHAAWSGAGPSCLALVTGETADSVRSSLEAALEGGGRVLSLEPDERGLLIE